MTRPFPARLGAVAQVRRHAAMAANILSPSIHPPPRNLPLGAESRGDRPEQIRRFWALLTCLALVGMGRCRLLALHGTVMAPMRRLLVWKVCWRWKGWEKKLAW